MSGWITGHGGCGHGGMAAGTFRGLFRDAYLRQYITPDELHHGFGHNCEKRRNFALLPIIT